ncbi:MAG: hypothetical protein IKT69_04500 [Bacteroidales bacterium]|nr:hypothetical protein [Bacteroidales bacterium]
MKKLIILITALIMPLMAGAQAQITTKKVKIEDFTQKVTKVVLNGNPFYDTSFKDEVAARWRISPYEFCTLEEFEGLKGNDSYYFLILTQGQFRKETAPGLQFISLVKGGQGADKGIGDMLEVVSLPFASAEYPSGRELIFLPAFLDIIQNHTLEAMENDFNAYGGLSNTAQKLGKAGNMDIVISEDDLNSLVSKEMTDSEGMVITDEDDADSYMLDEVPGTLVSYVVAPSEPVKGSFCYKMLIDAQTHELYYYRKHKISPKAGAGFLPEDIERINKARK